MSLRQREKKQEVLRGGLSGLLLFSSFAFAAGPSESVSILNRELYTAIIEKRDIFSKVLPLKEKVPGTARYLGTTRFLVQAPPDLVRRRLTDYSRLRSMSHYITTVDYDPRHSFLLVKGKVLGYEFGASLRIQPHPNVGKTQWIRYHPLTVPPTDDRTDIFLEPWPTNSTIVHLESEMTVTSRWIPDALISRAYRLVVESIADRARAALEAEPVPAATPAKTFPRPLIKKR